MPLNKKYLEFFCWIILLTGLLTLAPFTKISFSILGVLFIASLFSLPWSIKYWQGFSTALKLLLYFSLINFLWMIVTFYANEPTAMGNNLLWSRHVAWFFFIPLLMMFVGQRFFYIEQNKFILLILLVGATFGFYGIGDSLVFPNTEYGGRAAGGMNPIEYGVICTTFAVISLLMGIHYWREKRFLSCLLLGVAVVSVVSIVTSEARGSWVALGVTLFFLFWVNRKIIERKYRYLLGGLSVFLLILLSQVPIVESRFVQAKENLLSYSESTSVSDSKRSTSIGARLEMWKASWIMVKDNPVMGVGVGGFQGAAEILVQEGRVNSVAARYYHSHNQYFSAMATRGFVGLVLLGALLAALMYYYWLSFKQPNSSFIRMVALSGIATTSIYIIAGIFDVPVEGKPTLVLFIILNSLMLALIARSTNSIGISNKLEREC